MPVIKIPKTPNSAKLLSALTQIEGQEEEMKTEEDTQTTSHTEQQQQLQQQQEVELSQEAISRYQQPLEEVNKEEEHTRNKLHSKDIQLEFYAKSSQGWPKNFSTDHLIQGIENGNYRYTYKEATIEQHEIIGLIKKGEITLEECFKTVEDSIFRKIRQGQSQERTPPTGQASKHKAKQVKTQQHKHTH